MAGLIALVAAAPGWRSAGWIGWTWGVGHFTVGNNWIATAFTYQAKMPPWLGGLAVFGLSLYLALFPALSTIAARLPARRSGAGFVFGFAGCWIIGEWLRGWVCTGFPWNPFGAVALGPFDRPGLAAVAPWLGTYALSGLMVLLAGGWWLAFSRRRADGQTLALAALPVALLLLPGRGERALPQGHVPYTLVQPDIEQSAINDPARFQAQFVKTARLSLPIAPGAARLVLWPESGVRDYLREGYPAEYYAYATYAGDPVLARWRLARTIGRGSLLLAGTEDLDFAGRQLSGAHNVVTALDGEGNITASYAKAHLVPYGEYLPMREWLEPLGIARLVPGEIDFLPGPGPRTLDLGALGKAGIQVCYEIVFSGEVVDRAHRPDYLFNPSNDGWFGTWGPPQHLAQARLRAIEEGLPILRATTNGISAVIDADGIVRQSVPGRHAGRLDGRVPPARKPTLFARMGNMLALCWAAVLLVLSLVANRRRSG
ncbi:MAG: apolipoprotein N-acyltransferase [Sphingomonadales bacterium]|nr:apolipoprotein N-acyltransferase [Sphingomonadales bacterium]